MFKFYPFKRNGQIFDQNDTKVKQKGTKMQPKWPGGETLGRAEVLARPMPSNRGSADFRRFLRAFWLHFGPLFCH